MNRFESLENEALAENIELLENYHFKSNRIKGLYCNNTIALSKDIKTQQEKACILSEELGHHHTSYGNIIHQSTVDSRKQEHRARMWAYNYCLGLQEIIQAFKHGCNSVSEAAEYLDVTEQFFLDAIESYKNKFGLHTTVDKYLIYFEPLGVLELYK